MKTLLCVLLLLLSWSLEAAQTAAIGAALPAGRKATDVIRITVDPLLDPVPASNRVDWTIYAGVQNKPTGRSVYTNVPVIAVSDLNTVIANAYAVSNVIVVLSNATYVFTNNLKMKPGVTLRGQGTNTLLVLTNQIWLGNDEGYTRQNKDIFSGAYRGSSNIVLAAAVTDLSVGNALVVTATNDWSFVHPYGYESGSFLGWTGDDPSSPAGNRNRGFTTRLIALANGTNLTIWPPCPWDYTNTPARIEYIANTFESTLPQIRYSGLEEMAIQGPINAEAVYLKGSYFNWISNVYFRNMVTEGSSYSSVQAEYSLANTIQHCTFEGYTSGHSAINARQDCTGLLVENNVFLRVYQAIITASRGGENVFVGNYVHSVTNTTTALIDEYVSHGSHKQSQYWAHNVGVGFRADNIHGPSSSQVFFRNWGKGEVPGVTTSGYGPFWNDAMNYHNAFVGNVAGYSGISGYSFAKTSPEASPTSTKAMFSLNYHGYSTTPVTNFVGFFTNSAGTYGSNITIHGNVTFESGSPGTNWSAGYRRTLENCYFYSSRPSWWGTNLQWPAFGPDVPNHTNMIPAQWRYIYGTNSF